MQDKRDAGQDGCRTGGCRIRGMQDTRMQARWDVGKESQIIKIILQYVVIVASPCLLFLRVGNLLIGLFLRVGNLLIGFSSDSLVFCERKSNWLMKKSKLLPSLFCHGRPERIAHGRSFVKSNRSEPLTVTLLFRAT